MYDFWKIALRVLRRTLTISNITRPTGHLAPKHGGTVIVAFIGLHVTGTLRQQGENFRVRADHRDGTGTTERAFNNAWRRNYSARSIAPLRRTVSG